MNVGGPAVLIESTLRGLDADEFDVRLITGHCADDEADYLESQAKDVSAIRLDGLGRSLRPQADLTSIHRLAKILRDIQPDIVHTHTTKAGVVGRMAVKASRCGAGIIHTFHGHLLQGYFTAVKTGGLVAVERGLARVTDRLVAVAPEVRDDLLDAGVGRPQQYEVIPPGVQLGPLPDRASARIELGLPGNEPVVTMMGRLTAIKRPDRFADAARLVHISRPDARFAVAGSGDLAEELQARLAGLPVTFLGWRSDIETVLAASDALVLTSDNEGTPLSLIQAGLAGLPVIATEVGGVSSVVQDGLTGYLVPPSAPGVAKALERLLGDPEGAARMGEAARIRMSRDFGLSTMLRRHADLYQIVGAQRRL